MPSVLRWLSTKLNCSSQVASLLAATASGDVELVRGIIKADPDLGLYNTQGGLGGGRSALTVAAERGDLEILEIIYEGAVRAKGEAFARQYLNAGAERGQTPLMRACVYGTSQHVECVAYLLSRGADPFAETEKGETCLHMAAKNAYTECLSEILSASVSIGGSAPVRLADMTLPYTPPVKFVDMRNAAGFTPLHLATLKNSPAAMQVLLGAGAAMDAGISDAGNTPHLAKGSTALHIAAARGSQPCCSVLLDFQATVPGMDLRRIRNQRGLKASQLARLAGHDGLAALLSERQGGARSRARASRRRRRNREALHTQGGGPRPVSSPEAVLALLVQRAKLLLALREVGLDLDSRLLHEDELEKVEQLPKLKEDGTQDAKDEVAAAVAEFTELWKKGELDVAGKNGGVLSSLIPADMPVAKLPDEILGDSENGEDSYAAAAMVQAALNAMTYFSPVAKPLDLPPTELKPTSPIAAAMVVQAAIRRLAGKGASQNSTSAAMLLQSISQAQNRTEDSRGPSALGPTQQAESSTHSGTSARPAALHTISVPPSEEREATQQPAEQVQRILSKARRRQRRNALQSIEVAALEANQGDVPAVESSARSAESLGAPETNPLMDNPLFPTPVDGSMAPGERRRAALRQAALKTAPLACSHPALDSPCSSSSVPHGSAQTASVLQQDAAHAHDGPAEPICTPFANPEITAGGEEELPPAFPWELYVSRDGQNSTPDNPFSFSNSMPSRKHAGKSAKAAAVGTPRTPTDVSGKLDPFSDGMQSGQASPTRRLRHAGSQEVPRSQASLSESLYSTPSRRFRADASDAPSAQSSMTPMASRILRTDSLDGTCTSNTPRGTPQASGGLLSDESGSEFDRDEDEDSSDAEAKGNLDRNASLKGIDRCAICMDRPLQVGISTCDHKVCYGCAYQLCSRGLSPPICPFCRGAITTFVTTDSIDKREEADPAL